MADSSTGCTEAGLSTALDNRCLAIPSKGSGGFGGIALWYWDTGLVSSDVLTSLTIFLIVVLGVLVAVDSYGTDDQACYR